jgi:hypothetical protein
MSKRKRLVLLAPDAFPDRLLELPARDRVDGIVLVKKVTAYAPTPPWRFAVVNPEDWPSVRRRVSTAYRVWVQAGPNRPPLEWLWIGPRREMGSPAWIAPVEFGRVEDYSFLDTAVPLPRSEWFEANAMRRPHRRRTERKPRDLYRPGGQVDWEAEKRRARPSRAAALREDDGELSGPHLSDEPGEPEAGFARPPERGEHERARVVGDGRAQLDAFKSEVEMQSAQDDRQHAGDADEKDPPVQIHDSNLTVEDLAIAAPMIFEDSPPRDMSVFIRHARGRSFVSIARQDGVDESMVRKVWRRAVEQVTGAIKCKISH